MITMSQLNTTTMRFSAVKFTADAEDQLAQKRAKGEFPFVTVALAICVFMGVAFIFGSTPCSTC